MEINKSYAFEDFEPWSGAKDTWETLEEYDKIGTLEAVLEDLYPDGIEETTLNDILWFETESVFEWVGLHYSSESGIVSEDPLCNCCGEQMPETECEECLEMVCNNCLVKCTMCNKQICGDCANEEKAGEFYCDECVDKL